jgi:hypothetical protein
MWHMVRSHVPEDYQNWIPTLAFEYLEVVFRFP